MDQQTTNEIPDWIKSDRLTDFIEQLREEGYKIGISQYIAAQQLVLTLIDQGETLNSPGSLGGFLGPIFCSSPTEQEDFQQRFKRWSDSLPTATASETLIPEVHSLDTKAQILSKELGNIQSFAHQLKIGTFVGAIIVIFLYCFWNSSQNPIKTDNPRQSKTSILIFTFGTLYWNSSPIKTDNPTTQSNSQSSTKPVTPTTTSKPSSEPSVAPSKPSELVFKPVVNASSPFLMDRQKQWLLFFILAMPVTVVLYAIWRGFWSKKADLFLKRQGMEGNRNLRKFLSRGLSKIYFLP